jgi:small subunit ribosomal protein S20
MPNIKSAKKELRKGSKRRVYNVDIISNLKELLKKSRKAIDLKEAKAAELVAKTLKAFDKAAQKGVIKKNAASRSKSRLSLHLNKMKASK